jgi:Rhodopirellula transposase DDE domain
VAAPLGRRAHAHELGRFSRVYARLDEGTYPDKIQVSDAELKAVNLHRDTFHPEWNYTIKPRACS